MAHCTKVGGELVLVQVNWNTGGSMLVGVNSSNWTPPVMLGPSVEQSTGTSQHKAAMCFHLHAAAIERA